MNTRTNAASQCSTIRGRVALLVVAFGVLSLAPGCGDKPEAKAPVTTTTDTTSTTKTATTDTTKTDKTPVSDTSSNIHIDDAILKACGIEAPKAYFSFDSANIKPDDAKPLDAVATCFSTGPLKGKLLKLVGHADPRGDGDYNFALGQARADAISKYLASKGLDKAQMSSTSRGAMDAVGTDEPSWAKDRRVDLLLGS
jgi:peptidoglycan-associated lipoprotein